MKTALRAAIVPDSTQRVTESHDVDWYVSATPLPTNQRPFSYKPIIIAMVVKKLYLKQFN